MSKINDIGKIARTTYILGEARNKADALSILAQAEIPDATRTDIYNSYRRLRRKQMLTLTPTAVAAFILIVLVSAFSGIQPETIDEGSLFVNLP